MSSTKQYEWVLSRYRDTQGEHLDGRVQSEQAAYFDALTALLQGPYSHHITWWDEEATATYAEGFDEQGRLHTAMLVEAPAAE